MSPNKKVLRKKKHSDDVTQTTEKDRRSRMRQVNQPTRPLRRSQHAKKTKKVSLPIWKRGYARKLVGTIVPKFTYEKPPIPHGAWRKMWVNSPYTLRLIPLYGLQNSFRSRNVRINATIFAKMSLTNFFALCLTWAKLNTLNNVPLMYGAI